MKIKQIYRLFFSFVTLLIIKLKRFVHTSLHNQVYYSIKLLHAECCLRCRSYVNCAVVPVDMRMQTKTASHAHLSKTTSSHATFKSTYNVIRLHATEPYITLFLFPLWKLVCFWLPSVSVQKKTQHDKSRFLVVFTFNKLGSQSIFSSLNHAKNLLRYFVL